MHRHSHTRLGLLGAAALFLTNAPNAPAEEPPEILAACPQWIAADASNLYWMSQHDDRELRKMSLADNRISKLGKDCSTALSGSPIADSAAVYCIDGNWQNIVRLDKASGAKAVLPMGHKSIGPIVPYADDLYFAYSDQGSKYGIARVPKTGGDAQTLVAVSYPVPSFAVDATGLVWLDAAGKVLTQSKGQAQPKNIGEAKDCAHDARVRSNCHVVADSDFVYLSYVPRCGSHDVCPRNMGRVDRMPRKGGAWTSVTSGLQTVQMLQLHGDSVFFSDCISGTIAQVARQGGQRLSIKAPGSCWAFALSDREVLWFDGGKKLDWSDCHLRRVSYDTFK